MTEDLAFFLGAYASEGCTVRPVLSVRITNSVPAVLNRIAEAADRSFGEGAHIRRPSDRCALVELNSKAVVEFLDYLGCGSTTSAKRIPDAILRSPREMVLAFLQGLSLGAHIHAPSRSWAIGGLDSPRLLDDLQAVLTNLGVVTARSAKFNAQQNRSYDEVYATGAAARRMVELVPFIDPKKTAVAARLASRFPPSAAEVVPEASVARMAHVERPAPLQSIMDDNLHFSPVSSVCDAGEREVFDISVPSTQAFVGNGIVNHNTVNMPEEATVEEVEQLHIEAWNMGIKAIAIYRDNCKVAQPLATVKKAAASEAEAHDAELAEKVEKLEKALENQTTVVVKQPIRERLPRRRRSNTFAFRVADCEGYVHVGEYEDGRPGEVFMKVSKQGSTLAGIMDAFAMAVSFGLQHGVPLSLYVRKYTNMRFEPAGMTDDPELRIASSLVDYIFRRLAVDYLPYQERAELGILTTDERIQPTLPGVDEATMPSTGIVVPMDLGPDEEVVDVAALEPPAPMRRAEAQDAPYCYQCGTAMQRAGSCYVCSSCGTTSGCS